MNCVFGRLPMGKCVGWHQLTEEAFVQKLRDYEAKKADKEGAA